MKQAITLTASAQQHIEQLLKSHPGQHLRVGLNNKGCGGNSYQYDLIQESDINKFDEKITLDGGILVIEARSLLNLLGSTLDWQQTDLGAQFVWDNPNVTLKCGCGVSVGF